MSYKKSNLREIPIQTQPFSFYNLHSENSLVLVVAVGDEAY